MNEPTKIILLVVGVIIIAIGAYTFIDSLAAVNLGLSNVIKVQDNSDDYFTMVLGLILIIIGVILVAVNGIWKL